MNRQTIILLLAVLFLFVGNDLMLGQTADLATPHLHQLLERRQEMVVGWERQAVWQIFLTTSVIIFGALVTGLQISTKRWSKQITLILGIATSIVTGISAKVIPADSHTLQRSALYARGVLDGLSVDLEKFPLLHTDQDRLNFEADFMKKLNDFDEICMKLMSGEASIKTALPVPLWETLVYAQSDSEVPSWVKNPPESKVSFYFVGQGEALSLTEAQSLAFSDAVHNASASNLLNGSDRGAQMPYDLVAKFATVESRAFTYDNTKNRYHAYALLRISREIASLNLKSYMLDTAADFKLESIEASANCTIVTLKNQSGRVAFLSGWRLKDKRHRLDFTFTEVQAVGSGVTVAVNMGDSCNPPPENVFRLQVQLNERSLDPTGGVVTLLDRKGREVSSLTYGQLTSHDSPK